MMCLDKKARTSIGKVTSRALRVGMATTVLAAGFLFSSISLAAVNVRAGADASATNPMGKTGFLGEPSIGYRGVIGWVHPSKRFFVGVNGGVWSQAFPVKEGGRSSSDVKCAGGGVVGHVYLGPVDWGTRPYLGLELGLAKLDLPKSAVASTRAELDSSYERTKVSATSFAPMLGLDTPLGKHVNLQVAFRYESTITNEPLAIGRFRVNNLTNVGFGFGLFYNF